MKKYNTKITDVNAIYGLTAVMSGVLTGLFGAGGGGITYYLFEKTRKNENYAELFAQTLLVTLPSSIVSCAVYFIAEPHLLSQSVGYLLPCAAGGLVGAMLSKYANKQLKLLFSLLLIMSGGVGLAKQWGII